MPITIKSSRMQYRKSNGDYVGVDAVSERKTSEFISAIESTGSATQSAIEQTASTASTAIDTKAQQARDSIPSDYTALSDEVTDLKSALKETADELDNCQVPVLINLVPNEVLQPSGSIEANNSYTRTDYIDCEGLAKVRVYAPVATNFAGFFNAAKTTFISVYIGAGTNEYNVPADRKYLVISAGNQNMPNFKVWGKRYYDIKNLQDEVADIKNETIADIDEHTFINSENIFSYTDKSVLTTASGWKLNRDTGLSSYNASYKLVKYKVNPDDVYRITSDDSFQFQSSDSVPSSGTSNRIGKTFRNGEYLVKAPTGSTHLIVSTLASGSTSVVKTATQIIEASGLTKTGATISDTTASLYKNEVENKWEFTRFYYSPSTGAWKSTPIASNVQLETNTDYIIYCGSYHIPNDDVAIEVRVLDENDTIKIRAHITPGKHYAKFNTGAYTKTNIVLYVSTSSAPADTGVAYASNVILFKGTELYLEAEQGTLSVPDYDKTMLSTKEAIIRSNDENCAINGDSFIFFTDYHHWTNDGSGVYNAETTPALIKHILENTGVDFIVNNGDLLHIGDTLEQFKSRVLFARNQFDQFNGRMFHNIGNHEWYALEPGGDESTCMITGAEIFGLLLAPIQRQFDGYDGDLSYYIDNKAQKVRYFFMGCDIYCQATSSEQIPWFMRQIGEVPAGCRIVVFAHRMWDGTHTMLNDDWKPIADAMDALKARSSAFVYDGVTYNYSQSDAVPVAFFSGHSHQDGSLTTIGGIPVIFTTTDAYRLEETGLTRTLGTDTEQAFDVVQIDFTSRKIYLTRIGAGSDREFSY